MRLLLLMLCCAPLFAMDASNVLLVANEKAEGSLEIAQYYAGLRGVPEAQILKISASDKEEITREEFNRDIWEPVKKYVLEHDNILAIVPTRGVPLKVQQQGTGPRETFAGRDLASVDGELALIRYGDYSIDGRVDNPILNSEARITLDSKILVVCRLDGPTVEIAKGLVEKAILAETLGCHGESFLDTRGLTGGDGYQQRDDVMEKVEDSWKAANLPYIHDTKGAVFDLSERTDTLHYYGWYAGNPGAWKGAVKFRTGGIDVHLHSFSGTTVRNVGQAWVAPLLNWGATATYGTCYEPYTTGFPYENIFWDRLVKGWSFGEAGQVANHLLSWMAVFCGDPLYTPYPANHAATHARYREALIRRLVPPLGEIAPLDENGLTVLPAAEKLLRARADAIAQTLKKDPVAALAKFDELRFLISDMGLEAWLTDLSAPFNEELERRFEVMQRAIKADSRDTAAFAQALVAWKGLAIHARLLEFKAELEEDHEKEAAKLLKKANADVKAKRWLRGWMNAAEAEAYHFAASRADAQAVLDGLKANAEAVDEMKKDTDKDLAPLVEKAQRDFDKGRYDRAAKALGSEWRWYYPEADQRKAAEALAKKIAEALSKEE